MCGIFFIQGVTSMKVLKDNFKLISHRGPDNTKIKDSLKQFQVDKFFGFHRLAIHGLTDVGDQPLSKHKSILICNGEIYNYKALASAFVDGLRYETKSDCEIILDLYKCIENKSTLCNLLDGVFAFVLYDEENESLFCARDPIGVRPLFYGYVDGNICFSSELKALKNICTNISEFPPGHYYSNYEFVNYTPLGVDFNLATEQCSHETLRNLLIGAVEKRLDSERPVGFFLSGGLDSSLVCAIASRILKTQINTFSIGINDSPDLKNAAIVAKHINSIHTEIKFTTDEALNILHEVIYQLESYDCTTIRASVPMYIMAKHVSEKTDFKVMLSGEGADELFGGYLYFHNAPTHEAFHNETQHLLRHVHKYDVLRADRCTAGHGLELRVPFFDKALRNYVNHIHPTFKRPVNNMEKHILREAFDVDEYLPKEVLYRQKNGMSDAVGYTWVDFIRNYANSQIDDKCFEAEISVRNLYTKNVPVSKEELLYRQIYEKYYGKIDLLPHIWRPKYTNILDPSAKLLDEFTDSTQLNEQSSS
tara:strand:+ start:740 stop:2344 length:1605 start_codon:yes stop_codon:yes gene_type:complete